VRAWGRVDLLVNNACICVLGPYVDRTSEDTRREFELNYCGHLNTIDAVLPVMRQQRQGVIHNVGSGLGITGYPGISGYASAKGAIEALTHTLALEFGALGLTANLMRPPLTRTKSSTPLGVPPELMADPVQVGRGLARKVGRPWRRSTPALTRPTSMLCCTSSRPGASP
jgi:NAD(P)-dependent dehydrogenase (short-subunit alcohol dehydrogenase family)